MKTAVNILIKPKFFDVVIVVLALFITAGAALSAYNPLNSGESFVIEASGRRWTYPINTEAVIEAEGPLGISVVEIRDGAVRMVSSPCPDETCVAVGSISKAGQWIACLPNQVFIYVEGKKADDGIDGATW